MDVRSQNYTPNKSTRYFSKLSNFVFLAGLPNFWVDELDFSKNFIKLYGFFSKFINLILYLLVLMEVGAFVTQHNLTQKQNSDRLVFGLSQPLMSTYRIIMTYHTEKVKTLLFKMSVELKTVYNDEKVEMNMIKKSKFYSLAFLSLCNVSLIFYGLDATLRSMKTGVVFSTLITAWPLIEDESMAASVMRVVSYLAWWVFMTRVYGTFAIVLSMMVCLEHQYRNLRSYFGSLNNIFEQKDIGQTLKERQYENGLKIGIKLHSETLWCKQQIQDSCSMLFVGQILLNISVLVLLMSQMLKSDRSVETVFATVSTSLATLLSTGFLMWTAGDVTVEASNLPTAIYSSGWENCNHLTASVRKLTVVAMAQAQEPIVIEGFGVIQFSYQSYLSIVKSTYSVFSVIY